MKTMYALRVTTSSLAAWLLLLLGADAAMAGLERFELDRTVPLDSSGTVALVSRDARVTITGSDRDSVRVVVRYVRQVRALTTDKAPVSTPFDVDLDTTGGDLLIRERATRYQQGFMVLIDDESYEIAIEMPRTAKLTLRGVDDIYRITGLRSGVQLVMGDGGAHLEDVKGDFTLSMAGGGVEMIRCAMMVRARYGDGELVARDCALTGCQITQKAGSMELATSLSSTGHYALESGDGPVTLNVLGGGGNIRVRTREGRVRAGDAFELIEGAEMERLYNLPGGNAGVRIRTAAGAVTLLADR